MSSFDITSIFLIPGILLAFGYWAIWATERSAARIDQRKAAEERALQVLGESPSGRVISFEAERLAKAASADIKRQMPRI